MRQDENDVYDVCGRLGTLVNSRIVIAYHASGAATRRRSGVARELHMTGLAGGELFTIARNLVQVCPL